MMKVVGLILMSLLWASSSFAEGFGIRFGVIEVVERVGKNGLRFGFVKEERRVPLLTIADGVYYGLEYSPSDESEHVIEIKAVTPHEVIAKSSDILSSNKQGSGTVLNLKPETVKGKMVRPLPFDRGDKPGIYRLEITLDGKPYKVIEYEAYVLSK